MGKEQIINHGNLHDSINMKALIEAQASNFDYCGKPSNESLGRENNDGVKKLTKTQSSIRGRLNKTK